MNNTGCSLFALIQHDAQSYLKKQSRKRRDTNGKQASKQVKKKNTLLVDDMTLHLKDPRSHKKFLDQTDTFSKSRIQN